MIAALLAVTHLVAFILGAFVCYRLVMRAGRGRTLNIHLSEALVTRTQESKRHSSMFLILMIVALFITIVIGGWQARTWQQQAQDSAQTLKESVAAANLHRGCLNRWAQETTDTITTRSNSTAKLRRAEKRKGRADDAVTDVFVTAFLTDPPPPDSELKDEFARALQEYVDAKAHLAEVSAQVESTTETNPYPELDLNCEDPLESDAR